QLPPLPARTEATALEPASPKRCAITVTLTPGWPLEIVPDSLTKCAYVAAYEPVLAVTEIAIVVNDTSAPLLVPALFAATRRKWYVVPALRLDTTAVTGRLPAFASRCCVGVLEP